MVRCCFGCPYNGSYLGVKRHIIARHKFMVARQGNRPGRPRKGGCGMCGGFHRDDLGPGYGQSGRVVETRKDIHTMEVHATGRYNHGEKVEFPTVKVIVMSGGDATGRMDLRQDALMLGAAKSLAKPFELADLLAAVREVLEAPKLS